MSLKVLTWIILKVILLLEVRSAPKIGSPITWDSDGLHSVNCGTTLQFPNLSDFSFNPHQVAVEDTVCYSLHMFNESGLLTTFNISTSILGRFIEQAQKEYQKVPYHNWHHGFSVLQFSFAIMKSCKLLERSHLLPLEGLALLTAAMCHDLDHPGTNSQYQIETNSSLARKYKNQGSILERHHIDMTLTILENIDTNFISHFDESKQTQFKELINHIILATDLQEHLKMQPEMKMMISKGFNELNDHHRALLRSIIISCADLSDQGRDWKTSRKSVRHLMNEFFTQGDQERLMGLVPSKMMDRDRAEFPQLETDFLTHVIIPNFQLLTSLYAETIVFLNRSQQNLIYWQKSAPYFENQLGIGRKLLDIISDKKLDNMTNLVLT